MYCRLNASSVKEATQAYLCMLELSREPQTMPKTAKHQNPYPQLLKTINCKYVDFLSSNRFPTIAYIWGIDRKLEVDQSRLILCFFLFATSVVVSIKHTWFVGIPIVMLLCGASALWIHLNRKRSIERLANSLTAEERTSMAKALRDMLLTETEISSLANYNVQSDSAEIKNYFGSCHENLTIAAKGFALNLISEKPDPLIVVESIQFLMFDEPHKPTYWWDIELLGQFTYTGFLTRLDAMKRQDQEKVADAENKKRLSEQLAAL
jgi:hypothetical protein